MTSYGLQGKRVLITGASQGIGKATALAFAAAGADVAINARSAERLEGVVEEARKHGVRACAVIGNLGEPCEWEGIVQAAVLGLGGLDILINNGPGIERDAAASDSSLDADEDIKYESAFRINVRCAAALMRHAAPHLAKAASTSGSGGSGSGGAIVNVSSAAGTNPDASISPYCVAKAALQMLTRTWALKLAKDHVRVNAVQPGMVWTPALEAMMAAGVFSPEQGAGFHPLGRISTAEEQANVILFLASNAASFMTGAIVPVDGGLTATSWVTAPQSK